MQSSSESIDVLRGIPRVAEVGEEEPRRPARENGRERVLPDFETDIRRWRGRQDERPVVDTDAGRVSHESDLFRGVKVTDVVRGVAGRIRYVDFARTETQRL